MYSSRVLPSVGEIVGESVSGVTGAGDGTGVGAATMYETFGASRNVPSTGQLSSYSRK